jgi:HAD superfamily hydrolase (TIGR01509 family)
MTNNISFVLYDCDDTLVGSEKLAFAACCSVVNRTLAHKGVQKQFTPEELCVRFVGKSFRAMIAELACEHGFIIEEDELKVLVLEEENQVIAVLSQQVQPTAGVVAVLNQLSGKVGMAVVSSSAMRRVLACLKQADLERFFAPEHVFSAATSLPVPTTKPDPAVYLHALSCLSVKAESCVAVEDSKSGVLAAVRAGILVVGYVGGLPEHEQSERTNVLKEAGAAVVIKSWDEFLPTLATLGKQTTKG